MVFKITQLSTHKLRAIENHFVITSLIENDDLHVFLEPY